MAKRVTHSTPSNSTVRYSQPLLPFYLNLPCHVLESRPVLQFTFYEASGRQSKRRTCAHPVLDQCDYNQDTFENQNGSPAAASIEPRTSKMSSDAETCSLRTNLFVIMLFIQSVSKTEFGISTKKISKLSRIQIPLLKVITIDIHHTTLSTRRCIPHNLYLSLPVPFHVEWYTTCIHLPCYGGSKGWRRCERR